MTNDDKTTVTPGQRITVRVTRGGLRGNRCVVVTGRPAIHVDSLRAARERVIVAFESHGRTGYGIASRLVGANVYGEGWTVAGDMQMTENEAAAAWGLMSEPAPVFGKRGRR